MVINFSWLCLVMAMDGSSDNSAGEYGAQNLGGKGDERSGTKSSEVF